MKLSEIQGNFDLRDPDNAPGMHDLMANAHAKNRSDSIQAFDEWNDLAKQLGATQVHNQVKKNFSDRDSYIGMTFTKGIHIDMFRSDVTLHFPFIDKEHIVLIKRIFKKNGIDLYDFAFSTYGNKSEAGKVNGVRVGYYSSLGGEKGQDYKNAIIQVVELLEEEL